MAQAAAAAAARGAAEDAVELAEHALRLTPKGSPEWAGRLLDYADQLLVAGEEPRLVDLLTPVVDSLPSASARARAHLLLSEGDLPHSDLFQGHYERALAESAGDPALRATVLARKSITSPVSLTERIREAEAWALEALAAAPPADAKRLALHGLAWVRTLGGKPVGDLHERIGTTSDDAPPLYRSVARVLGVRFASRGEVGEAQACLTRLLKLADERGEARGYLVMRLHLCELALRAGEWDAAERLLDEWGESSDRELVLPPAYERCRALLAAGRGHPDEADRWAGEAIARSEARGERWDVLEGRRARGIAALLAHDPKRAAEDLRAVWEHARREGIDNPGSFPVAPDLVEALVEVGERDAAVAVTDRLARLAEEQAHPWGLASARRCRALLLEGDDSEAAITEAAADYERLGLRFDAARSLLLLGRAQRRRKRWGAARATLELATTAFEQLGSPGWAEEARSELARVGARRPRGAGELTPAEQRVVDLAVDGLSNKEIARALFVSVHTVEVHLSRAYAKLGVRSRTQLARLKV